MKRHTQSGGHAALNSPPQVTNSQRLIDGAPLAQRVSEPTTPPHLLVSELAARWAVSTASIYRMIDGQELGHLKVRGAIRIPHQVVLNFEAEQLAASTKQVEAA